MLLRAYEQQRITNTAGKATSIENHGLKKPEGENVRIKELEVEH